MRVQSGRLSRLLLMIFATMLAVGLMATAPEVRAARFQSTPEISPASLDGLSSPGSSADRGD